MARSYPALDLRWPTVPDDDAVDRILAQLDDHSPAAVDHHADGIRVFFSTAAHRDRALATLSRLQSLPTCTSIEVSDEDWAARSQASLGPITVGKIVVTPPWGTVSDQVAAGIRLVIQPSMGFGTGHHASTRLCLRLLQNADLEGMRVLDVGTGSGVLALAAAKSGARHVLAVDSDPDALTSAAENLELNDAQDLVGLRLVDLGATANDIVDQFDVVLANLTGGLLVRHAVTLTSLASSSGLLIVSGFDGSEADAVSRAFAAVGWEQADREDEESWVGFGLRSSPTRSTAR